MVENCFGLGDPHQSTATEEQNPFVTKSGKTARLPDGFEGSLRSQRGQSNEKSIMQVRDADKPLASLSKKSDRENLNELISEWNRRTGLKKEVLLRQLRDYFNVKSIDEIPGKWKGDAEAFVQEKIRDIPRSGQGGFSGQADYSGHEENRSPDRRAGDPFFLP